MGVRGWCVLCCLALLSAFATAADAPAIAIKVEETAYSRVIPFAYYDQGVESVPLVHPGGCVLAGRRYGKLGDVDYSLLAYTESATAATVTIGALAGSHAQHKAWRIEAIVRRERYAEAIMQVLERISTLDRPGAQQPGQ